MIRRAIAALGLAFALPAATFAGQTPATVAFGVDQWISAAATNWSTIALADAAKDERGAVRTTTAPRGGARLQRP